ncbi:uncharacterized protein LOC116250334 [Nymphaea colorata]|uniref:Uncharacterized protein n=1 Tax=Nymphaea colorata TaxID=210225 RepID=A0A5K1BFH5_9MAGN|nr:uncharacterized protein LOC116250334 [Nymphaea colorata]
MVWNNWLALKRLRRAIQKVRFLLNINLNRFRLSAAAIRTLSRRNLSLPKSPAGLLEAADFDDEASAQDQCFSRTISGCSEDIDQKAEDFIARFYSHIQMERQVSLELRYCNRTLERTWSDYSP